MNKKKKEDSVILLVVKAINQVKEAHNNIMDKEKQHYLSLATIKIGFSIHLNAVSKSSTGKLEITKQQDYYFHIWQQMKEAFSVIYTACKDYSIKYGAKNIPKHILNAAYDATLKQIVK